ncbi:MAG: Stp1/IreP family PP2C-type Ser/Thr phosphatase [Gammaproteobacteria bacterium]|nr:Stp1/IreP family PP2C-type Ser/Thr phosphatase [Gammaproteobacteria bacterium]
MAALTDTGMKRSHNEDSIASEASCGLVLVADGMGGYRGGEIASALAANTIVYEVQHALQQLEQNPAAMEEDEEYSSQSIIMRDAICKANQVIYQASHSLAQYQGMGTTVVAVLFLADHRLSIAHVGDSRLYRYRDDYLETITSDHTLIQQLIDRGFYTPEEARASMNKNLVTRALGVDADVKVDIQEDFAQPGDIYLLCSDGLNDMIDDKDIHLTIRTYNDNLDRAAAELIKLANANGGKDNVSVLLARIVDETHAPNKHWLDKFVDWFF